MKALIGKKIGMTQVFTANGKMLAVTAVQIQPNMVVAHKTAEKDGYQAVVLATGTAKRMTKPLAGQMKKAGIDQSVAVLKEFRTTDEMPEQASSLDVSVFQPGDMIDVSGISKGKGYAGVVKRHNFSRGPETHGSDHHRAPGSIGSAFPQRVTKGHRMPGHMGADRVTVKKLEVIEVHPDHQILLIKGAIPGPKGSWVEIKGYENA